jgi:hypothetical protein
MKQFDDYLVEVFNEKQDKAAEVDPKMGSALVEAFGEEYWKTVVKIAVVLLGDEIFTEATNRQYQDAIAELEKENPDAPFTDLLKKAEKRIEEMSATRSV